MERIVIEASVTEITSATPVTSSIRLRKPPATERTSSRSCRITLSWWSMKALIAASHSV